MLTRAPLDFPQEHFGPTPSRLKIAATLTLLALSGGAALLGLTWLLLYVTDTGTF